MVITKWVLSANWKTNLDHDDSSISFSMKNSAVRHELGLCPESAYRTMIETAIKNKTNDKFWQDQLDSRYMDSSTDRKSMNRVLATEGNGIFYETEYALPDCDEDGIQVRAVLTGVCRSDIDMMQGNFGPLPLGMQGHEGLAQVEKVGNVCPRRQTRRLRRNQRRTSIRRSIYRSQ